MRPIKQARPPEVFAKRSAAHSKEPGSMLTWKGPNYSRISPGVYTALASRVMPPAYLARYRRWSMAIAFRPISEPEEEVLLFLNLGKDGSPRRHSAFFRAWTMANGEMPTKRQQMALEVFLEPGLSFEIEVVDAETADDGSRKDSAEVYSKVKRIVSVTRARCPSYIVPIKRR